MSLSYVNPGPESPWGTYLMQIDRVRRRVERIAPMNRRSPVPERVMRRGFERGRQVTLRHSGGLITSYGHLRALVAWQERQGMKLDMVFNAESFVGNVQDFGVFPLGDQQGIDAEVAILDGAARLVTSADFLSLRR